MGVESGQTAYYKLLAKLPHNTLLSLCLQRVLSIAESQNPAMLAALRRCYSRLWQKNWSIFTSAASPKTAINIHHSGHGAAI